MKRWHYGDPPDLSPWMDAENWPCLNKSHTLAENPQMTLSDDGEIDLYIQECRICGLAVRYNDDYDLTVQGYAIAGREFDDLEFARRYLQSETRLMFIGDAARDIADLCRKAGVVRLELFSVMESMLEGPDGDLNVLVRFDDCADNLFSRYFDLREGLERILENGKNGARGVNLVEEIAVKNPYMKRIINRDRISVYEE